MDENLLVNPAVKRKVPKLAICSFGLFLLLCLPLALQGNLFELLIYTGLHWFIAGLAIGSMIYEPGKLGKTLSSIAFLGCFAIAVLLWLD